MRLSPHFALEEFLRSRRAAVLGIDMRPPPAVIERLQALCVHVLEPLRVYIGLPITISSGWRPAALNAQTPGSSLRSQHVRGEAADLVVTGMTPFEVCEAVMQCGCSWDQLILEYGQWTHVSYASPQANRRDVRTAVRRGEDTEYPIGLHPELFT